AESLFRRLTANEDAHPVVRAQAWAEIAQIHDRRDEFEQAMSAMLNCKAIIAQREGPVMEEAVIVLRHLKGLADSLTPAHFQRWKQEAQEFPQRKTAVLTSFPRSGTTLLE